MEFTVRRYTINSYVRPTSCSISNMPGRSSNLARGRSFARVMNVLWWGRLPDGLIQVRQTLLRVTETGSNSPWSSQGEQF